MKKQGGFTMNGLSILGICLVLIGLLIIGYDGVRYGFGLSLDFQSLLAGGLLTALIGTMLIPGLPAAAKLAVLVLTTLASLIYIHSMPDDFELMMKLIADVVIMGFAAWLASIFLRK